RRCATSKGCTPIRRCRRSDTTRWRSASSSNTTSSSRRNCERRTAHHLREPGDRSTPAQLGRRRSRYHPPGGTAHRNEGVMRNWVQIGNTVDWILENHMDWDQTVFRGYTECGTTYCFAGATLMLNNLWGGLDIHQIVPVSRELLGVSKEDGRELFYGTDTDIHELADLINGWAQADGDVSPHEGDE